VNIFHQIQQVSITVAKNGLVSTLKDMAHRPVFSVKVHRVALIDPLKYFIEGRISPFDQEMDMVGHQYVGIEKKRIKVLVLFQKLEVFLVIGEVFKDFLPLIAPCDDVIKGPLELNPRLSCHRMKILNLR